jgi:subtilisin family serine protease
VRSRRENRLLAAVFAAALLVLGCATSSPPPSSGAKAASGVPATDRQVMVTYPPASPSLWARTSAEFAEIYGLRILYAWTMQSLGGDQCVVFEVPAGRSPRDMVRRLAADPRVGLAQTVETFHSQGAKDPYAHLQHSSQALHLDQAHRIATGKGVRVAVVDTGIDFDHPDLRGRVVKAQNLVDSTGAGTFTTEIHGTAVAGVIAATAGNDIGIAGVAPGAEIYALKACWQQAPGGWEAVCNSYTLAKAVDFAILQDSQVLNFSLAGPPDPLLGRLIGTALAKGIVVVAADGGSPSQSFPASQEGVLGVQGLGDGKGNSPAPAGRGPGPALAAPAVDIVTTVPKGSYDFFSGSSLAAAQVSGVAALLLEKDPRLTPARIAEVIRKTARPLNPDHLAQVDACAALVSLLGQGDCG